MNWLSWNCRGAGNPSTVRDLESLVIIIYHEDICLQRALPHLSEIHEILMFLPAPIQLMRVSLLVSHCSHTRGEGIIE